MVNLVFGNIIGFLIYRVLRLKCPSCKSREFTKIDENRHSKGYEQYSKKDFSSRQKKE